MSKSPLPTWAKNIRGTSDSLETDCTTGMQPDFAPRLPIRVIPISRRNTLSASTLRDVLDQTQRIITYAAYEVVNGVRLDFSDLRSVDSKIVEFATLQIEPFEEGSFVIPTALKDSPTKLMKDTQECEFTGNQIIQRFAEALGEVAETRDHTSIGLVQSIENLGSILKREAERIEFYPIGIPGKMDRCDKITVDSSFIRRVSNARKQRVDPTSVPDVIEGILMAVDLAKGTFKLQLDHRKTVGGTFSSFMTDMMAQSLRKRIIVEGVVEYIGKTPKHIRAFFAGPVDD